MKHIHINSMETIFKSEHLTLKFDEINNILFTCWSTPAYMLDEDYRKEFESCEKVTKQIKPKNLLVHSIKTNYVAPVETQAWMTPKLNKIYELVKIDKVAFVMSTDFLAQLAIDLVAEEVEQQTGNQQFFDSEEKAIDWLKNKVSVEEKAA